MLKIKPYSLHVACSYKASSLECSVVERKRERNHRNKMAAQGIQMLNTDTLTLYTHTKQNLTLCNGYTKQKGTGRVTIDTLNSGFLLHLRFLE